MVNENKYRRWVDRRIRFEAGEDFVDRVMGRIAQYEQGKVKPWFDTHQFYERISAYPLAKAGLIAACAVIGFMRIVLTVMVLCG
ncbi:MAG: hypothetical protein ACYTF1_27630 [Planctomycetota bacterium]|jgi:hypothetical protein